MIISYMVKDTIANTDYIDINRQHRDYVLHWLAVFVGDMTEKMTGNPDIARQLLSRDQNLPKGRRGPNSVLGFAGGLLHQHTLNPKRNFTLSQTDGIEYIFEIISNYYDDAEPVNFQEV